MECYAVCFLLLKKNRNWFSANSSHGSAFSLNDGQCVSVLMKMAIDLDLTMSYHKRRLVFPNVGGAWLIIQEKKIQDLLLQYFPPNFSAPLLFS